MQSQRHIAFSPHGRHTIMPSPGGKEALAKNGQATLMLKLHQRTRCKHTSHLKRSRQFSESPHSTHQKSSALIPFPSLSQHLLKRATAKCTSREESVSKLQLCLAKLFQSLRSSSVSRGDWAEWSTPMSVIGLFWSMHMRCWRQCDVIRY